MRVKMRASFLDAWSEEITFSTGDGKTNRYRRRTLSSREFIAHVSRHRTGPKVGSAWSPFDYIDDKRCNANCDGTDVLPLDIDDGATLGKIREGVVWSGYAAVIVSSHSHTPAKPKFRIIVPLARPFRVADFANVAEAGHAWKLLCIAVADELGLTADPNAMLLSQFFYDPRCPENIEPVVKFFEGRTVDASKLLDRAQRDEGREGVGRRTIARSEATTRRNEASAPNPFERDGEIDLDAVRSAVMSIPNDKRFNERKEWLKVCGALHHATGGSADGLEIWLEWCDRWDGAKSDAALNEAAWRSMRDGRAGGATAATLIYLAKRDGWPADKWGIEEPIEFKDERRAQRLENALTVSSKGGPADQGDEVVPKALSVGELNFTGEGGDLYNGKIFAKLFLDRLLFIHETGDVLRFDTKGGWLAAAPGTAERAAKGVVNLLKSAANDGATMRHIARLCDVRAQRAMIEMARSEHGITRRLSEFDSDPMMLGVANGVVDLRTGRLLPVSPALLVSKRCNVAFDPRAECPRFDQFMREVQPDIEVRAFLRRFAGYCLTGRVDQHVFGFFYGHGANGKSTFIELLAWILGDYAGRIATELLMQHQRSPQGPSPDVLLLRGKRLVFANETEEGARLASSRIKELTGGDTLSARAPYGRDFVSFAPSHKLVIVGNHQPEIADTSFGMWRRVRLVPWEMTIVPERRDPQLLEKLKTESSGILNWALDGLRAMQEDGLQIPKAIVDATRAYRDDQDIIGEWIDERCSVGPTRVARKGDLYDDYWRWAERNGHKPLAQKRLTRRLTESGFRLSRDRRAIEGLALKTHDADS